MLVVDDILLASSASHLTAWFRREMRKVYKLTDLSTQSRLVGIDITYSGRDVLVTVHP